MYSSIDIARKILLLAEKKKVKISHLKLQKLMYFVQGWHLAYFKKPLFKEELEAWIHGPVEPSLYRKCKKQGTKYAIIEESIFTGEKKAIKGDSLKLVERVFEVYKKYSGTTLEFITHQHKPWKDAYAKRQNPTIEKEAIRLFFRQHYFS